MKDFGWYPTSIQWAKANSCTIETGLEMNVYEFMYFAEYSAVSANAERVVNAIKK